MAQGQFEYFQLRCFVAVAEELSFRRASDRMNMTQPPLSRQIKMLEDRVQLRLFNRNSRQVELTAAGRSFYLSALEILQKSEQAVLKARQAERGDAGEISLGFVPSCGLRFVPMIAVKAAETMPNVQLNPIEMMGYEIIEAQRSGRIDLGLTRMERDRSEIERFRVVSETFVAAIPRSHRLAEAEKLTIADFDGEPYISFTADTGGYLLETLRALFSACGITPDKRISVSQTHSIVSLVNHGLGFALVPKSIKVVQMENIVYRDIDLPAEFRSDMYMVSKPNETSAVIQRMKELVIDVLRPFRPPQ